MAVEMIKDEMRYDAFISYRHVEQDSAIASRIQKDLEHFHIPKTIQEKTGYRKINRIFRDKEELGLTDDLSEELREAIEKSRFLILICSKASKESVWVGRELDLFLETHALNQVLTVLVDGEPDEVIRERLFSDHHEPLSADYRLPKKEARKTELPRIAAAILGCRYDELVQRSRQYQLRRMTAALLTVVAAGTVSVSYLAWSRAQIAENLRQAQISQSKNLANEVENLLDNDRDVTAAQLAPYTVPDDQSLTPAASWQALQEASGAYVPKNLSLASGPEWTYRVTGELKSADDIRLFRGNHEQKLFCTADSTYHVHVWDTAQRKDLLQFQENDTIRDLILAGNVVVTAMGDSLQGYDIHSGKKLWTIDTSFSSSYGVVDSIRTNEKESKLFVLASRSLLTIRPENGKVLSEAELDNAENLAVSADGRFAAFYSNQNSSDKKNIQIYDFKQKKSRKTEVSCYNLEDLEWTDQNTLAVLGQEKKLDFPNNGRFLNLYTMSKTSSQIYEIDPVSAKTRWKSDFVYGDYSEIVKIKSFQFRDSTGKTRDAMFVGEANAVQIYDRQTGEKLRNYELPANITFIDTLKGEESGITDTLVAICSNGAYCMMALDDKYVQYFKIYPNNIEKTLYYSASDSKYGFMILEENSRIVLEYSGGSYDHEMKQMKGAAPRSYTRYLEAVGENYILKLPT